MLRATLGAADVMVTYGGGGGKTGHQLGQWRWSEKTSECCRSFSVSYVNSSVRSDGLSTFFSNWKPNGKLYDPEYRKGWAKFPSVLRASRHRARLLNRFKEGPVVLSAIYSIMSPQSLVGICWPLCVCKYLCACVRVNKSSRADPPSVMSRASSRKHNTIASPGVVKPHSGIPAKPDAGTVKPRQPSGRKTSTEGNTTEVVRCGSSTSSLVSLAARKEWVVVSPRGSLTPKQGISRETSASRLKYRRESSSSSLRGDKSKPLLSVKNGAFSRIDRKTTDLCSYTGLCGLAKPVQARWLCIGGWLKDRSNCLCCWDTLC